MDRPPTAGPLAGRTAWARNLGAPVRNFLSAETAGAVVLVGAALVALVWANSPWPRSYEAFWTTELALSLNDHVLSTDDLRGFVNEGLMTLFSPWGWGSSSRLTSASCANVLASGSWLWPPSAAWQGPWVST